jgi:DNA-directed RNA polymerase specialized sigma24 family protein
MIRSGDYRRCLRMCLGFRGRKATISAYPSALSLGNPVKSSDASVTGWIGQLKVGNHEAAQKLWSRYFQKLVRLARARLGGFPRRAVDEEDVALTAFDSFCRGAANGRFPKLSDRNELWHLLIVITARKVIDVRQHETRQKRGAGAVQGESAFLGAVSEAGSNPGIEQVVGPEPTPAFAAQVAEQTRRLLKALPNEALRDVALWKMEGDSIEEIAEKLGCSTRTVDRKLDVIRSIWKEKE